MIYTLTANPAIDLNALGENIKPNGVNRMQSVVYSPNGKGINVSLVLKHYGVESTVLGFFSGFTGKYILDELEKRQIKTRPVLTEGITRINTFVADRGDEYKFVCPGPVISKEKQEELLSLLASLKDITYLIISGSLPSGVPDSFLEEVAHLCQKLAIPFVLDTSTANFLSLMPYRPLLIKPNDNELMSFLGRTLTTEEDFIQAIREVHHLGAQNILLTLGEKGLYFSDGASIYFCTPRPVSLVSSACAGDATLAAFLSEWLQSAPIEVALQKAAATGASVAESHGIGDLVSAKKYITEVSVRKVV